MRLDGLYMLLLLTEAWRLLLSWQAKEEQVLLE